MNIGDKRRDKRGKVWIVKDFMFHDGPWMRSNPDGNFTHVMRDDNSAGKFVKRDAFEKGTVEA